MKTKDGGSAFPYGDEANVNGTIGMTLRDYFAARSPAPDADWIDLQQRLDRQRNPYNDSHKPAHRSTFEIDASWRFKWADAMIVAREKGEIA